MDRTINEIESIAVLRKEVKNFVNATVKSKFFEENSEVTFNVIHEVNSDKKEYDFFSVAASNTYSTIEFIAMIPKKVSKKVDKSMFDKVIEMYAKRAKPIKISVTFDAHTV